MPKRVGYLWGKCFTLDTLYTAYCTARKGKRKTQAVYDFERNLGYNIQLLLHELETGTYSISPYRVFTINENKPRTISAPAFRDEVVQHAIYAVIEPIFDRTFVFDSHGCRKRKGIHSASDRAVKFLKANSNQSYTLKMDLRKFYYSIDRKILQAIIKRKLKDDKLVKLICQFAEIESPTGLPIGNLLSQILALIYLSPMDHYIKETLRVKYYVRYVDDFIVWCESHLHAILLYNRIKRWLYDNLNQVFSKYSISKVCQGLNFVGYRI